MPIAIKNIQKEIENSQLQLLNQNPAPVNTECEFAFDVKFGLSLPQKKLNSKYLYDNLGSQIFQQIMGLEEYYPARCETNILENHKGEILGLIPDAKFNLIDLGAGDGSKTMILIEEIRRLKRDFAYIPIDISQDSNETLMNILRDKFSDLEATILTGEYSLGIKYINSKRADRNLILFMGCSLCNLTKMERHQFLLRIHDAMKPGDLLLIGWDLKKEYKIIEKAYYDSKGVTARFGMNMLTRINSELGADFDPSQFFYHSYFDCNEGCVKSMLVSKANQQVHIPRLNMTAHFKAYQHIEVQEAHKLSIQEIDSLASQCHFEVVENLYDDKRYFVDSIWKR